MIYSRRQLGLIPLIAASSGKMMPANTALPSNTYRFEDLPVKVNRQNRSRSVLKGETHSGFPIEMHMTELGPGEAPHPPHHHVNEEMVMLHEGTLEVTIAGRTVTLGPGSSAYVASNEEHGWRNVGATRALYFVLALGQGKP